MSGSSITKKAFADALRDLMQEIPFEKITVAQICEKYGLSRKSFYYHFRDKYELVTWIFDTDYVALIKNQSLTNWEFLDMLCGYLYENRDFYRKVLVIQGQNSFSGHFEEFMEPLIRSRLQVDFDQEDIPALWIDFISDGFICSIKRWLTGKDCIPADQFVASLEALVNKVADSYSQ